MGDDVMPAQQNPVTWVTCNFLSFCEKVRLSDISQQPKVVQRSFVANCHDSVLFLALGLDYWFNPADQKAIGLHQCFINPPQGGSPLDLNLGQATQKNTQNVWLDSGSAMPANVRSGYATKPLIRGGGFSVDGAANYNLVTKTLEYVVSQEITTPMGMGADIEKALKQAENKSATGEHRDSMVACYKYLRSWWEDALLTKIGLCRR
jgi:hypothetical protein